MGSHPSKISEDWGERCKSLSDQFRTQGMMEESSKLLESKTIIHHVLKTFCYVLQEVSVLNFKLQKEPDTTHKVINGFEKATDVVLKEGGWGIMVATIEIKEAMME